MPLSLFTLPSRKLKGDSKAEPLFVQGNALVLQLGLNFDYLCKKFCKPNLCIFKIKNRDYWLTFKALLWVEGSLSGSRQTRHHLTVLSRVVRSGSAVTDAQHRRHGCAVLIDFQCKFGLLRSTEMARKSGQPEGFGKLARSFSEG